MLTNAAAKAAGARSRAYKLADAGGLFLFVTPAGTKSWRLKYRFRGREKLKVLGRFPEMSIAEARAQRETCKALLRDGVDPSKRREALDTFEQVARAWHRHNAGTWSPAHAADVLASLERDVFPEIGNSGITELDAPALLSCLKDIEARGQVETARRVRQRLSAIFEFAIAQGLTDSDPAAHLGRAMGKAAPPRQMPALTAIDECRALLSATDDVVVNNKAIPLAHQFLALTAVRLEAVRGMRWDELDLEARTWTVPAARMKLSRAKKADARFDHVVPLSPAAIAVLEEARLISATSNEDEDLKRLVFPGSRVEPATGWHRPIGEGAIRDLIGRTRFSGRHVPHGWRSSFSTILNEDLGPDWSGDIDRALAHAGMGKVEAAYNRATLLDRRRRVFDRWGEILSS